MNVAKLGSYRWNAVADQSELHQAALRIILDNATMSIQQRGKFHFVLSGGDTPRGVYQQLRSIRADWSSWHIYFSDERCLLPNDPNLNFRMAGEAWLDHVPIPGNQLYKIPIELGAGRAACEYAQTLRSVGIFDLTFLGLGEDGHTASLFPGHEWGAAPDSPDALAVFDAPKPPLHRVSMSAARLNRSRQVVFLVSGESKHMVVAKWRKDENIPARAIMPKAGADVLLESSLLVPLFV
ncbi:MAG: 6-phosphogluconolactonase [Nitrosomonadales bacterium]|nr:MAG: 6-phosphogluconolactonase [Nitrosomonadales bacterium]